MAILPCFLCGKELDQRTDKNRHPYFVCDPCGMQIFVRRRQGIENLAQLIAALQAHDFPFRQHALVLHEIQAVLTEIRGLKKELKALEGVLNIFSEDEHKERTRELLNRRIDNLLSRLERIANEGAQN
jgi:DNA-directed RNA polymerase subunit RPC12/RpoP